jgi:hypothetical protein
LIISYTFPKASIKTAQRWAVYNKIALGQVLDAFRTVDWKKVREELELLRQNLSFALDYTS